MSAAEAIQLRERSPGGVGGALEPESQLRLALDGGERPLAMAQRLVQQVVQVMAPGGMPLFLTDGFKEYATALLTPVGRWVRSPRRQAPGPAPKPRWMPRPALRYAQVVNAQRHRRVGHVRHRGVFGTWAGVKRVLAASGWQLHTACMERVNRTLRPHVAAVGRRAITLCQGETGIRQQLTWYPIDDTFGLPHTS